MKTLNLQLKHMGLTLVSEATLVSNPVKMPKGPMTQSGSVQSDLTTSHDPAAAVPIIIGAIVGGAAVILCILASCYYLWCWQSKDAVDDAEIEMGHRPPVTDVDRSTLAPQQTPAQLPQTPAQLPQYQHRPPDRPPPQKPFYNFRSPQLRPPEQKPFFDLTVGDVHSRFELAGELQAGDGDGVGRLGKIGLPHAKMLSYDLKSAGVSAAIDEKREGGKESMHSPRRNAIRRSSNPFEDCEIQSSKFRISNPFQQVSERKIREDVAEEVDTNVPKVSLADLDLEPTSLTSGCFNEDFLGRLRKPIPDIGNSGHKVVVQLRHGNSTLGAELKVFKTLGRHANLTRLLAVAYSDSGSVTGWLTEFAELGSLDHVLTNLSDRHESATADVLLTAAMQVLDGMLQLQEHNIVHCYLALRNILVFRFDASDCDQVYVKLTDYGLASTGTCVQVSTSSVRDCFPFRWMSPETILRRRWSEKSDVWAFAVTVWEMFTHGLVPYTFISSDPEVGQRVVAGHRLERPMTPTECPPGVFGVMLKCWEQEAAARPTFAEVKRMILSEFRVGRQGECCICLERKLLSDLLALVPCGHRCVCANHVSHIVGRPCPMCRAEAVHVIRVFD
jgi:hypothetical protein